jgi:hypothetical protein
MEFQKGREKCATFPFEDHDQYGTFKKLTYRTFPTNTEIETWATTKWPTKHAPGMFRSVDDFWNKLDKITETHVDWMGGDLQHRDNHYSCKFHIRDPLAVLQEMLDNPTIKDKVVWAPRKIYDQAGKRVYTDLHSTKWWWEMQVYTASTTFPSC